MEDLSVYPFSNGNHYSTRTNENENEMFDEDEVDENEQVPVNYRVEDEIHQQRPVQPVQNERGGRRKGVPRRLQLSPEVVKTPTQRLLPLSLTKPVATTVHHHEQPILTSDQEDENETDDMYQQNQIEQNYLQLDLTGKDFIDNNNNNTSHHYDEYEDILEIVDDILADMVTIIVRDIKQQRRKLIAQHQLKQQTNGTMKLTNGKHLNNGHPESRSSKFATKSSESSTMMNDLTKSLPLNSPQTMVKHKLSPTTSPNVKRQKTIEPNSNLSASALSLQQQQQQQLLWEMTQQLMMSAAANESESLAAVNSSLLKQQLLGLTNQVDTMNKVKSRPSKGRPQSPVMHSNANINPASGTTSPFERTNFAPRRRGRPPKYVTDRALASLSSLDLDPTALTASYDQLLSAIENGINPGASSAAFQTALASMLGQQAGLSLPTAAPVPRNGAPASMAKNGAGQTRHSLPSASKLSSASAIGGGLDMPLMATKKRGPGRPPKSQTLFDSHQILQATQRLNSSTNSNNYPPTMVPSTANAFNFNAAAFAEMLQQQHQL